MSDRTMEITCPECQEVFPISISDAVTGDIEARLGKKFERKNQKLLRELEQEQDRLRKREETLDKQVEQKAAQEVVLRERKLRDELSKKMNLDLNDMKAQLAEKTKQVDEAAKNELLLRKKTRDLEAKEKQIELDVQRKLDEERQKIEEDTSKRLTDGFRLKEAESERLNQELKKQLDIVNRKLEQGSQQTQGETFELSMEDELRSEFHDDLFEPVPKGVKGADVLHKIITKAGQCAGTLIWEFKDTKNWSEGWIEKLKSDQRAVTAEIAVLVTRSLPKGVSSFASIEGVLVVSPQAAVALAHMLRHQICQLFFARNASAGKDEKLEAVHRYLTSTQFIQRIEAFVDAILKLKDGMDRERRSFETIWATRDQQLRKAMTSVAGLYGEVQGIIGAVLPRIESLELDGPSQTLTIGNELTKGAAYDPQ